MKYSNIALFYFAILLFCSCASGFPKGKKKKNEKRNWEAIINTPSTDSSIKSYWVDIVDDRWNFFKEQGSTITKEDVPNLKFIHSVYYTIDSVHLFNFKKGKSIASLLRLDKKFTTVYVLKNDSIQAAINPGFIEGKWVNSYGYGVPNSLMSKAISKIYKEQGEVYNVNLFAFPSSKTRLRQYLITYIGKRFMMIDHTGNLTSFEDELLRIKDYALRVAKTLK